VSYTASAGRYNSVVAGGIWIALGVLGVVVVAGVLYWQLVVAEGAYLGTRVVALLYDWFAPRYDGVKQYDKTTDALMLALPVMQHLSAHRGHSAAPSGRGQVLDVATGTGRLPEALLSQPRFRGHVTAVDASAKMLDLARAKLGRYGARITFMQRDAQSLPFDDASFDVVTCFEALEFMRDWRRAVHEMLRVLRPGGLLMLSNRIGPDAWKLPGRSLRTAEFLAWLGEIGVADAHAQAWLVDYDLMIGIKPPSSS